MCINFFEALNRTILHILNITFNIRQDQKASRKKLFLSLPIRISGKCHKSTVTFLKLSNGKEMIKSHTPDSNGKQHT